MDLMSQKSEHTLESKGLSLAFKLSVIVGILVSLYFAVVTAVMFYNQSRFTEKAIESIIEEKSKELLLSSEPSKKKEIIRQHLKSIEPELFGRFTVNLSFSYTISILFLILIFYLAFNRIVIRPLSAINEAAKKVAFGDLDQKISIPQNDEFQELSEVFNLMTDQVRLIHNSKDAAMNEVIESNRHLEEKVEQRTATIRNILDNVQSGFFMINGDLQLEEGFTKSCSAILGRHLFAGMTIDKMFSLSEVDSENLQATIIQVFYDVLPDVVSLSQIPERLKNGGKTIQMSGRIIRDEAGDITSMLFTITDATAQEVAERENIEKDRLLSILMARDAFSEFIADCYRLVQETKIAVNHKEERAVRRNLHTLKGNAMIYNLVEVSDFIHALEEKIEIKEEDIAAVEQLFAGFLEANKKILNIGFSESNKAIINVDVSQFETLYFLVSDETDIEIIKQNTFEWIKACVEVTASELLGPIENIFEQACAKLNKEAQLVIERANTKFAQDVSKDIFRNIPHAIRNSIAHGIEPPGERGDKPEVGTVKLSFDRLAHGWRIVIQDDGKGIDPKKIAERALEKKIVTEEQLSRMDDDDVIALIFKSGFSTNEEVDSISGRGVGMDALRNAVFHAGGQLEIESKIGEGTKISIYVDYQNTAQVLKIA